MFITAYLLSTYYEYVAMHLFTLFGLKYKYIFSIIFHVTTYLYIYICCNFKNFKIY